MRRLRPRFGLRARATIGFGATGFLVAVGLAGVTFAVARTYLTDQREDAATRQAYVNARLSRNVLRGPDADVRALLATFGGGTASNSVVNFRGEWFSTSVALGSDAIPEDLVKVVGQGHAGRQRYRDGVGDLQLAVGVPVAAVDALYFEVFPMEELEDTLGFLSRALGFGVLGAAAVAALVGRGAAGRMVRPLAPVADAAERIAGGALDTRLVDVGDPDLERLSGAFNSMAAALEERIERETRFAADVSHELRSPLTAVAAAVEVMERRRDQLPPQVIEAFTVLADKVETFQQMVLDLLEISRLDAGTAELSLDVIDLHHFITRVLALHGATDAELRIDRSAPDYFTADRRRLAQAVGNILDNAKRYAGGVKVITVDRAPRGGVVLGFEDRGPGVPEDEREAIFGRFTRGTVGTRAGAASGTGLGLALVAEHVRLHGGRAWVDDSPGGGARFVIELPEAAS